MGKWVLALVLGRGGVREVEWDWESNQAVKGGEREAKRRERETT